MDQGPSILDPKSPLPLAMHLRVRKDVTQHKTIITAKMWRLGRHLLAGGETRISCASCCRSLNVVVSFASRIAFRSRSCYLNISFNLFHDLVSLTSHLRLHLVILVLFTTNLVSVSSPPTTARVSSRSYCDHQNAS